MKIGLATVAALCMQRGLAVPHGPDHKQFHHKRAVVTSYATITNVVTVTDYNNVVWVDSAGNIVKTEQGTAAISTSVATSTSTTPIELPSTFKSSSSASPVVAAGNLATKPDDKIVSPSKPAISNVPAVASQPSGHKNNFQAGNNNNAATAAGKIAGLGVAYDAYSGTGSSCRPSLDSDFAFLASTGASMVRVYDMCFAESIAAAAANNLKLMIGLTTFTNFDANLASLVKAVMSTGPKWTLIDTVFIGNELVNNNAASASTVAATVTSARSTLRSAGFAGSVVTVDTWTAMRADPTICSTSDYCAVNAHAFFDGNVLPADAGSFVRMAQTQVAAKNGGKRVVITESGWPHAGDPFNKAIPSVPNQRAAVDSLIAEFARSPADLYLFMAYDTKWKLGQPEVERNFGIFDAGHFPS